MSRPSTADSLLPSRVCYHDGGRLLSGRKGSVNDCVVRAVSIVADLPYASVYEEIMRRGRLGYKREHYSPRWGVDTRRVWFKKYMVSIGFVWHKVQRGTPIFASTFSSGRFVIDMRRHYTAMIDGIVYDVFDCTLCGSRKICGYWILNECKSSCEIPSGGIDNG